MGRSPTRFKKELAKKEPKRKEIPYAPHEGVQGDEKAVPGDQRIDTGDKAAYRAWREDFVPASQEKTIVPDDVLNQANRDLQSKLDIKHPGKKIEFFNDQDRLKDDKFFIFISEYKHGFLEIVCGSRGGFALRGMNWDTLKPPNIATQIKKTIKLFQKGGDKEQMDRLFTKLLELFKRMDEHIVS
jgi:hypothetical protein